MRRIGIVADDLTGASDSGVQLARRGVETIVVLDLASIAGLRTRDALVVDADSRGLHPRKAYERVAEVTRRLREAGCARVYKKLDSTLRGNLGAELDAAMEALGLDLAVIAPAFPSNGRTTVGGCQLLHGVPVRDTELGRDPGYPVRDSDVVGLLNVQSRRAAGLVELATVRAGREAIVSAVSQLRGRGVQLVVFDAETDEDLRVVAGALVGMEPDVLWAGSAGLADALAGAWGLREGNRGTTRLERRGRPVLLVTGSPSAVTRAQVERYALQPGVKRVELDPTALLLGDTEAAGKCVAALRQARDVALTLGSGGSSDTAPAVPERLADALGQVAARVIQAGEPGSVILVGGDTARAVCRWLHVWGIRLLDELEPGVALGELIGANDLLAVTKAGAFGNPETLVSALHTLRGGD